jgi:non-specific serine/threonine protein kinase
MKPDQFLRKKELLLEVAELPKEEQKLFLRDACKDDPQLLQEILSVLEKEQDTFTIPQTDGTTPSNLEETTESGDIIGKALSHFYIEEKIASGGMGVLYKAVDTSLHRPVALKVLHPELLAQAGIRERFIREARAASALNHPGIVTIYEIDTDSGIDFIVMEYVEGCTLDEVISSEGVPLEKVSAYALAMARALQVAHEKGIVHRDLKPSNIMVTKEGDLKILDFGIAKQISPPGGDEAETPTVTKITQAGGILGTVGYMSPEQVEGKDVDHRSDIFSFGVILYEMISGRSPFRGDSFYATAHVIVHDDPKPMTKYRANVPEALGRIVYKALEKNRSDRYQTTGDLVEDLLHFQRGEEVQIASPENVLKRRPKVRSLAVLYLKNLGPEEDDYLCYGITEDLIVDLTRIGTLRVAPMRSIMKHKDSDEELEEIARNLDVQMILDGSIQRSESAIRVSAQLVDLEMGKNLWANRWEEPLENLPKVKQLVALGISRALDVDSTVVESTHMGAPEAQNLHAYECYLRAKYTFEHRKDKADLEVALSLYRKALSLEPSLLAARTGIARMMIVMNEYQQAEKELTSALVDARTRGLRADEANILRRFSTLHRYQSHWDEAFESAEKALEIRKELNDLAGEAQALAELIATLNKRSRFAEALELSERVLDIHRCLEDQEKSAYALKEMGCMCVSMGDYGRAMELFEEAREVARKRGDIPLEASCALNIGIIYQYTGKHDKALRYFEESLQIHTKLGIQDGRASSFNNIAVVHLSWGNYRKALEIFDNASMIHKDIGNRSSYALTLCNIAVIQTVIGEYDKAAREASKALVLAKELDYPNIIALANLMLGRTHFYKSEYEAAREYYLMALEVSNQAGLRRHITRSHALLGELHYHEEKYDLCHEHSEKARVLAKEMDDKEYLLAASVYLAALMVWDGKIEEGIKQLREVSTEANAFGEPIRILTVQRLLGQSLLEHGSNKSDREEGHTILEEALALAQEKEIVHEIKWIGAILEKNR